MAEGLKAFPFEMGDWVVPTENYNDEQCDDFAYMGRQQITAYRRVSEPGTSGWWIQTDRTRDWVDLAWFRRAEKKSAGEK